jgi:hypothetical protein
MCLEQRGPPRLEVGDIGVRPRELAGPPVDLEPGVGKAPVQLGERPLVLRRLRCVVLTVSHRASIRRAGRAAPGRSRGPIRSCRPNVNAVLMARQRPVDGGDASFDATNRMKVERR